ncbi:d-alanyl-D-alanine carboxypeptidase [Clostridium sp. CAG:567]|jgi:D-alanyl-D-alanine carboxypeptidase (penicillin-binding protein 5/6)|nr:d-alanyl-D-alanine carboxypeptidase [Clostridium sp. CAG:567]
MKKLKIIFFIFIFLMQFIIFISPSYADSDNLKTYCPSCILIEANTGKILYEKNSNDVRFPASTTKIMTAILTVENCNLDDVATVSHNAVYSIPYDYTHASLKEGEELTIEQLLYALMIPSANDAAIVLAEHISGSVEEFAKLMNKRAEELGCKNTHFVNPNGIHSKDHTSTSYDLALMGKFAMQNSIIRKIVSTTQFTLPATNKYSKADRTFNNSNDLLNTYSRYYYEGTTGVKTGYTGEAGNCIIASAKKNDFEVILVVLGGESTNTGLSQRYLDCKTLFDYAFNNYSLKTLNEKNAVLKQITVRGATEETQNLNVLIKDKIEIFSENSADLSSLEPEITLDENLMAPISANSAIGKITYNYDGQTYSSDLIAETQVLSSDFLPLLFRILLIFVVLYLLFLLLKKPKNKSKKTYKKKTKGGNYKFTQFSNY